MQGGVESHCQQLYPRLAGKGCEITVFTRNPYVDPRITTYEDVNLVALDCSKSKHFEAIVHTLKGILRARKLKPALLHIHSIGPSILVPLARIMGLKVVMTNHGPDYNRDKWGLFAKTLLRLGERWGSRWSNEVICISNPIADDVKDRYGRDSNIIPNGVEIPRITGSGDVLRRFSLTKSAYILAVGRFVPEKGFGDLIEAFNMARLKEWKLVIAGRADHESECSREIKEKAEKNGNIVLTGFLSGKPLGELYSHAGLFVLPSYHEGLPIVLLEAMSYGLLCLASDISANRCVGLPDENYFTVGDIDQLSGKLRGFVKKPLSVEQRTSQVEMLRREYNWDAIAQKTLDVYRKAAGV